MHGRNLRGDGKGNKDRLVPINLRGCEWLAFYKGKASPMLDNGADLGHIQEMLGHGSILTPQIYTHVSRKKPKSMKALIHQLKMVMGCFDGNSTT